MCKGLGYVWDEDWQQPEKSDVPQFINGLVDGSLSVTKSIEGTGDPDNPEQKFKFNVKFIGDKIKDGFFKKTIIEEKTSFVYYTYEDADKENVEKEEEDIEIVDGEFNLEIQGGEKIKFVDIPAGTVYQVWEETPDGWVLINQNNASGVIGALTESKAEFKNLFDEGITTATIIASKYLDNKPADKDANEKPFVFVLMENGKEIDRVEVQPGGFIQFNPITYNESDVGEHNYSIYEVEGDNPDIKYSDKVKNVKVTVKEIGNGKLSSVVEYDSNGMRFDNTTIPGSLQISKVGRGMTDLTNNPDFTFSVKFYNANGVPVSGDSFNWYVIDSETGEVIQSSGGGKGENEAEETEEPEASEEPIGVMSADLNVLSGIKTLANDSQPMTLSNDEPTAVAEIKYSGVQGTAEWSIDENGVLLIKPIDGNDSGTFELTGANAGNWYTHWPWNNYRNEITAVKTEGKITLKTTSTWAMYMLYNCPNLVSIDLSGWDVSGITKYEQSFKNCPKLESIDLSGWDTSKAANMTDMFQDCKNLRTIIGIDDLNTSSVTTMYRMFAGCSSLESLDLSGWDTSNVTNMFGTFLGCGALEYLNLTGWDIGRVNTMGATFSGCSTLESIPGIEDLNPKSVTTMSQLFNGCSSLTQLDLSKWNTSAVTNMDSMFSGCGKLVKVLGIENFDVSHVTTFNRMFYNCGSLTSINLSGWNTSSVTNMTLMFYNCRLLETIKGIDGFDASSVTTLEGMFHTCLSLTSLDLSRWGITNRLVNLKDMFCMNGDSKLKELNLANWDTSNVTTMYTLFHNCKSMEVLNVYGWDTSKITAASSATNVLNNCVSLREVTVSASFYASSFIPAFVKPSSNSPYTGKWIFKEQVNTPNANPLYVYDSAGLKEKLLSGDAPPGTYVWEKNTYYFVEFEPGADENEITGDMTGGGSPIDEDYVLPANGYIRPGYIFTGWLDKGKDKESDVDDKLYSIDDSGYAVIPANTYASREQVTLTAQWEKISSDGKVNYYINHYWQDPDDPSKYTLAATDTDRAEPGKTITVNPRKDYDGFIIPDAQEVEISDKITTYVSFYYNRVRYTVHFDGNGADYGSMDDIEMVGDIPEVLGNDYTKTGSAFLGWNTDPDGKGESYSAVSPVKNLAANGEKITLYAQWMTIDQSVDPSAGEIIVKCKAGQTIIIPDLPAGTTYEITETKIPYGWVQVDEDGVKGSIIAGKPSLASVTNSYSASGGASIMMHKSLEGDKLQSGAFDFELCSSTDFAEESEPVYSYTNGYNEDGSSNSTMLNGDDQDTIKIDGARKLHVVLKYNVFMSSGSSTALKIYGSEDDSKLIETLTGNGTKEYDIDGDTVRFEAIEDNYPSEYHATVVGEYDYMVASNGTLDPVDGSVNDKGVFEKNPWYDTAPVIFAGLEFTAPGDYVYYIREKVPKQHDSTIDYDESVKTVTVRVKDNGDGTLGAETLYEGGESKSLFENKMAPCELKVSKTLANAGEAGAVADKLFEFTVSLKDSSGNPLSSEYKVVIKKSDGTIVDSEDRTQTVSNGGSVFIRDGETFTIKDLPHGVQYEVTEVESDNFKLTEIDKNKGTIKAGGSAEASFTNVYNASAEVQFKATKNFIGGVIAENQFAFELLDGATREVLQTVYANTDGSIEFQHVDFSSTDLGKDFTYIIREVQEEYDGIMYDDHELIITIHVSNDSDGNLVIEPVYIGDTVFKNVNLIELPESGGPGITPICACGSMLVTAALLLMLLKRKVSL